LRIPVVSLGGQYNHLISRILSEIGVESPIIPMSVTLREIEEMSVDGSVFGGGPQRIPEAMKRRELGELPQILRKFQAPSLCICAAHQLLALVYGGSVKLAERPEFGPVVINVLEEDELLKGLSPSFLAWESHNYEVKTVPLGEFQVLARSENCPIQALKHNRKLLFGTQFHPEVYHTTKGRIIFENFIKTVKK